MCRKALRCVFVAALVACVVVACSRGAPGVRDAQAVERHPSPLASMAAMDDVPPPASASPAPSTARDN